MRRMVEPLRHLARSLALCALLDTIALRATPQAWPDDFPTRVEALALLQTLNAELLGHDSATATLQQWCADHRLAEPPRIVAVPLRTEPRSATGEQRALLQVAAGEPVIYRHVQLRCGAIVLSEAENWYVPARLTAAMNRELETTDTPFGAVVRPLQFRRRTLDARLLWSPLPPGWEMNAAANPGPRDSPLLVPAAVLEHHAVLTLPDGTPFSLLVETYSGNVLAFPPPRNPAVPAAH
jgi:chorismate-pyruvate lyase